MYPKICIFPVVTTLLTIMIIVAAGAMPVAAHSGRAVTSGIPIANLSHGEMAVLARYRPEIISLADTVTPLNQTFRTLHNYGAIEYRTCLWGIMPGTIADEGSPFNECAHAYLAATKTVLLKMRGMPSQSAAAEMLISRIDMDMVRTGAAFIGCQYSNEGFNTAEFVRPRWIVVVTHKPTFLTPAFAILVLPGMTMAAVGCFARLGRSAVT